MKKNLPKVSVIIPYSNSENCLENAVRSILNQTFDDFQILLINNNSTDNSPNIAWMLSAEDKRISLYTERRAGVSYAANLGIKNSKGLYISFMDANDYSFPERLARQVEYLDKHENIDIVSSLINYNTDIIKSGHFRDYANWTNTIIEYEDIFINRFIDQPFVSSTIMVRKNVFEEHGYFLHGDFPESYELILRWLSIGLKIYKIPEVLLSWNNVSSRIIHNSQKYRPAAYYTIKSIFLAQWLNDNDHPYVWIWGAGHLSRKRVEFIENAGIFIEGYIDVVNRTLEDSFCIHFNDFNWDAESFVISYVGDKIERSKVREFLKSKGKIEGKDFILAS